MIILARNDNSRLSKWWWTVDRLMLVMLLSLMIFGLMINLTASPAVAQTYYYADLHFFFRQAIFTGVAAVAMIITSMFDDHWVRRLCIIAFPAVIAMMVLTLLIGDQTKGATRWINFGFMKLQPSEFLKPIFIVANAWLLSASFRDKEIPAKRMAMALFSLVALLLVLQPDFGQTVLLGSVFIAQMALAGMPLLWIGLAGVTGVAGLAIAYMTVPYFAGRIDRFINPESGDNYQAGLALDAMQQGGITGRGLGEGAIKLRLPDAHSDYVFAVIGEEFGAIIALIVLVSFAAILFRGFAQLNGEEDPFRFMAVAGLLMQFGLQVLINVGVNIGLLPSKGMTLPFISYGGSSTLALGVGMGIVLSLTRHNRFLRQGMKNQYNVARGA